MTELQTLIHELAAESPAFPVGLIARCVSAGYRAASLEAARPKKKQAELLDDLVGEFGSEAASLTARLEAGEITAEAWQAQFEALIARYHTASLMLGMRDTVLAAGASSYLVRAVATQYEFLSGFGVEIQDAEEWQAGFNARAEMYAGAIKEPYWTGDTQFLPLPAMPAEGTQCLCITDPGVRVLTARGEIPIAKVVAGDLVLTHRMRWRPVLRAIVHRSLPTHRQAYLRVAGRPPIGCTADHRWMTPDGWAAAIDIHNMGLWVYNGRYEDLRELWYPAWESEQGSALPGLPLHLVLPLRSEEGLACPRMRFVRKESQGESAVAGSIGAGGDVGQLAGRGPVQEGATRRPRATEVAGAQGWPPLELVLARRFKSQGDDLSLPVGLEHGQRPNPAGHGRPSQERRSFGRSPLESRAYGEQRPSISAHDPSTQTGHDHGERPNAGGQGLSLCALRQALPFQAVKAEVLLQGLLPEGTPLYDLEVAEDHSFILEGTISHNSNCGCSWDVQTLDATKGDFDAFWRRSKEDSCATCLERERLWSPVRIRGWELE